MMIEEFKKFILRGNVLDLAIGVIIGATFGKITNSLVSDILMPPIGLFLGRINFSDLFINLSDASFPSLKAAQEAGAATINYGLFINNVIDFLIIGFVLFLIIRSVNRLMPAPKPVPVEEKKKCPYCLMDVPIKATRCGFCTSSLEQKG